MPAPAHSRHRTRPAQISLEAAPTDTRVRVVAVEGSRETIGLLAQLQVRPGAVMRVLRSAPLGGPLLVECGGSTVIISRRLAEQVRVEVQR